MALSDFHNYLNLYTELYYSKYMMDLDAIGDYFCSMTQDREFYKWISEIGSNHLHRYSKAALPSPLIPSHVSEADQNTMPAFAIALQEYFYKDYLYPEDRYQQAERKRITELESKIAMMCHAGRSTVASWKSGSRVPDKYKWWSLGITVFGLSYWHIQPFLDMIGCNVDMTCIEDIVLYYALCTAKSAYETFAILHEFHCDTIKKLFVINNGEREALGEE